MGTIKHESASWEKKQYFYSLYVSIYIRTAFSKHITKSEQRPIMNQ